MESKPVGFTKFEKTTKNRKVEDFLRCFRFFFLMLMINSKLQFYLGLLFHSFSTAFDLLAEYVKTLTYLLGKLLLRQRPIHKLDANGATSGQ